ncbi:hypothetical protein LTR85_012047 [Meristemomyces frigidus]|nr:hypothetical protein LTR85_012047 [Meristemomyces frigidus]
MSTTSPEAKRPTHGRHGQARLTPFCRYLLAGNCTKGRKCRYRHHSPERPIATAFAWKDSFTQQHDAGGNLISKNAPPDSYTYILPVGTKATFGSGMVPSDITFLDTLRSKLKVELVTTALEVTWYRPARNIWMECETQDHATQILSALDGELLHWVTLRCTSNPFSHVSGVDAIKAKIASLTVRQLTGTEMLESKDRLKYKTRLEFDGAPNLETLARNLNGQPIPELGNSPVSVCERLHVALTFDRRCFEKNAGPLKQLASRCWSLYKVQVHLDDGPQTIPVNVNMQATSRQ